MREIVRAFVWLVLVVVPPSAAVGQEPLTVEDVIRIGLENNYSIQIARNSAEAAGKNRIRSRAEFLPTVNASGGYTNSATRQETNSRFSFGDTDDRTATAGVELNWTLFNGFKMFAERGRYEALAKLGEYQARNVIENTVVAITRAYFTLVQREQLLDVARRTRDISKVRLEKEEIRNELGGASSTDLLNARVAFNSDQAALIDRELQVTLARQDLNVLLARAADEPLDVSDQFDIPDLPMDREQLIAAAHDNNSELLVAQQNKTVADKLVGSERSPFLPNVSFRAGLTYTDRTQDIIGDDPDSDVTSESSVGSVGLVASWNLFNGGRDKADYDNARIEAVNRHLELRDAANRLTGVVSQTFETYQKQLQLAALEEENTQAARQNLQLQQDRYQLGASSSLEFRDAQVSLSRAEVSLIVARYQARITRLEIDRLTGRIDIGQ